MALKTFDFKKVVCAVNGIPISGFADGDAITIEFDEDNWAKFVGADETVTRVKQNRRDGKITLRLQPSSSSNRDIARLARLDEEVGLFPVKILITDLLLGDTIFANEAWVMKDPGRTLGRDLNDVEWVYDCARIEVERGGGSPF